MTAEVALADALIRGRSEDGVYSFKRIPYAAPIEGINRWRPPQPPAPAHWHV